METVKNVQLTLCSFHQLKGMTSTSIASALQPQLSCKSDSDFLDSRIETAHHFSPEEKTQRAKRIFKDWALLKQVTADQFDSVVGPQPPTQQFIFRLQIGTPNAKNRTSLTRVLGLMYCNIVVESLVSGATSLARSWLIYRLIHPLFTPLG